MKTNKEDKKGIGYYFNLGEVGRYFFRKNDPNQKKSFTLKAMHGINKFSIIVFLCAVIYLVAKRFF